MLSGLNRSLRFRGAPILHSCRFLGAMSQRVEVPQGGTLEIDFAEKLSGLVKVDMVSQWQDHIDISCEGDVRYEVSEEEQVLSVKG